MYEYDDAGRLARSITTREPEFTDDDVALLLAHMAEVRDTGRYGERLSEATSDRADPTNYEALDRIGYVVGHRVNHAEAAVELYREQHKDLPMGAALYVERVDYSQPVQTE
ncbi:hypothetical protein [Leifsonia virtsii]|uniref:Type IV secretion protein Rhs n=1 Tax=Leifsonia virtsii TaxID=3035915 RepID=A0ABT8ISY0_9MICO|nr:hypothetical protein [Leifsonia virtsii]MDN4595900.1 hypothetical protein [Leifsonia virtsii]